MILTWTKQQEIKPISLNNKARYEQINKEIEEFELKSLLGSVFYKEIIDNYNSENEDKWKNLVEGCNFIDLNNKKREHKGIQYVLAYLISGQYVLESYTHDTFTGVVQKIRQDSEPISQGALKNMRTHLRDIAFSYFDETKDFLCVNSSNFPNWCVNNEKKINTFKIIGLKNTR